MPDLASGSPFGGLNAEGNQLFAAGRYGEARLHFEAARIAALVVGQNDLAAKALSNIGGCQFALQDYRSALHSFLEARPFLSKSLATIAVIDLNIASLYSQLGEVDSAIQWLQKSIDRTPPGPKSKLPQMQIEMASLLARRQAPLELGLFRQNGMEASLALFREAIEAADRGRDHSLYAIGWNRLGEELLRRHELPGAERAFLEAYRVRKLYRLPLDSSYWELGELRLAQGDLSSASALLDRAVELAARPHGPMPTWLVYHARGRVRLKQGRLRESLDDLRVALRLVRAGRWSIPATDTTRVGAESTVQPVYSALIEAGNRLYLETRDPALLQETFEAADENRASSLRLLVNARGTQPKLPIEYWEAIGRLQRAEVEALRSTDDKTQSAVSAARAEIVRMEAGLVLDSPTLPGGVLDRAQRALNSDTALLTFQLGESASWLWALDRAGLVLYALPPRQEIEDQVRAATAAIRDDSAQRIPATARLNETLFRSLAPRFQQKSKWLLALDQALLEAPIAALPDPVHPAGYLIERHAIQAIPAVGYWLESGGRQEAPTSGVFLGIGDAIYNTADPRAVRPAGATRSTLALPRLVGTSSELDRSARAWRGDAVLLQGADASRRKLMDELGRRPAVIHFATHFLESSDHPSHGLIALSLNDRNETELLQPLEISQWRLAAGLVVLSGCHSAAGAVLPGAGLLGLTRSFLIAGAQAVLASRWATPDEDGELFQSFYQILRNQRHTDPTQALRLAQLEMIRSGGWRARPRYWGTYFVMGNQ